MSRKNIDFVKLQPTFETTTTSAAKGPIKEVRKWRVNNDIDRTKRVGLIPGEVDIQNTLPGNARRQRADYDYKIVHKKGLELKDAKKKKSRKSHFVNNLDKRSNLIEQEMKLSKGSKKTLKEKKPKEVEEDSEKENISNNQTSVEQPVAEKENSNTTQKRSRKARRTLTSEKTSTPYYALSDSIVKRLEKLGGKLVPANELGTRVYNGVVTIPLPVTQLLTVEWPERKELMCEDYEIAGMFGDFMLNEEDMEGVSNKLKQLKKFMFVMDFGTGLMVLDLSEIKDTDKDFNMYVIRDDDESDKCEGPYKLSDFLKHAELVDKLEETQYDEDLLEDDE